MKVPYYLRDQLTPEEDVRRKRSSRLGWIFAAGIPFVAGLAAMCLLLLTPGFVERIEALENTMHVTAGIALAIGAGSGGLGLLCLEILDRYRPAPLRWDPVRARAEELQSWAEDHGVQLSRHDAIALLDTAVFRPKDWQPYRTDLTESGSSLFLDISPEGEFELCKLSQRVG